MLIRFLVFKYLRFDKTQPFISITAILAFIGVGVGVMVLIVAMAIMEGMIKHFEDRLFTMNYPLTIFQKGYGSVDSALLLDLTQKFPELQFSPYVKSQGAIKIGDILNAGIVYGVDFDKEVSINKILRETSNSVKFNQDSILVGKKLLDDTSVDINTRITLIFTQLQAGGMGLVPSMKRFNIDGYFNSGLHSYDSSYMYINISTLQTIKNYAPNIYDGIHIYSNNPMTDIIRLRESLPRDVGIVGWWEQNGNFFNAIAMEKRALFIVLMLIIIMASLNIISSLMMVIMTRRREIALLLSLGMQKKDIQKTFFYLGNAIGISGVFFGVLLAFVLLYVLHTFPIISLPADVYGSSKLPLHISFIDILFTIFGAILVVVLSSYYPSIKASKINPLSTLRSE